MEPVQRIDVVSGRAFVHQIKWDGIRGVAVIDRGEMRIFTRNGVECTASYPELYELPKQLNANQVVLDGELVVFEKDEPSFYLSLKRNRTRSENAVKRLMQTHPVKYIVFDMLFYNGDDVRQMPLVQRQKLLEKTLVEDQMCAQTENFSNGQALYDLMKTKNMEGIVSKRVSSKYIAGKRHSDWYKTKALKKMLCVVIGVYFQNALPASVLLGVYREGAIEQVGKVSSGLTQKDLKKLGEIAKSHDHDEKSGNVMITPMLTCWVRFSEWTYTGMLRHPVLLGFSDRQAAQAIGEEISI